MSLSSSLRVVFSLLAAACAAPSIAQSADPACHVGAYRLADRRAVSIQESDPGTLRWMLRDGTTGKLHGTDASGWTSTLGWTDRPDGIEVVFGPCGGDAISFGGVPGTRIAFEVRETTFVSHDTQLAGRLVLPQDAPSAPIVVLLHGSEPDSALADNALQRRLPAEGIGVFVYDKRGTGRSQGKYTQDFPLLADDAVAALAEARRLAGPGARRFGYQGPSQGGWIAPIAATKASVDFVIVGFGLAVTVLDEDREAIALNMTNRGYGPDVMAKAMVLADATGAVAADGTDADYARFEAVRERYRGEPWFAFVRGDFTWAFRDLSINEIRTLRVPFESTPWRYDPVATIARVAAPQLWILAADDLEAPSAETARRLARLRAAGRPITTVIYPHTEHGIYEYETTAGGERLSTRQPDGYLDLMIAFARTGKVAGSVERPSR
jgi:acetyl esterase/lipase